MSIMLEMQVSKEEIQKMLNSMKQEPKQASSRTKAISKPKDKPITKEKTVAKEIIKEEPVIEKVDIQKQICENIKAKVNNSYSMQLEQEQVLEDNSVLLTITI